MKLTPEVIAAIEDELTYQDRLVERGLQQAKKMTPDLGALLCKIGVKSRQVQDKWFDKGDEKHALKELPKLAALVCRAMLVHGVVRR